MLRKARDGGRRESDGAKGPAPVDRKNKKKKKQPKTGGLGAGQRVFWLLGRFPLQVEAGVHRSLGFRHAPASQAGWWEEEEGWGGGRNESREGAAPNVIMQWSGATNEGAGPGCFCFFQPVR